MMSLKRAVGFLEGKLPIPLNFLLDAGPRGRLFDDIDGATEKDGQSRPQAVETIEMRETARSWRQTDGQIHIGLVGGRIASRRTEQRYADDAKLFQLSFVELEDVEGRSRYDDVRHDALAV